jgi:hypothetical protein
LIDIEGAEFALIADRFFAQAQASAFFLEIHDWQAKPSRAAASVPGLS